jgi:hypothetical protein
MLDRVLTRGRLLELVDELANARRIVGPVKRNDHYFYEPVDRADALDLDFTYCAYGPKAFLLPATQTLFRFKRHAGTFETTAQHDEEPIGMIGVHPCDVNAIRLLDHVFANTYADEHYLARRRQTFILGIDCPRPCTDGVFCGDMHGNEATTGFDLMCYPLARRDGDVVYGAVFGTDAGREFILYAQAGEPPTVQDERVFERYQADKQSAFPQQIPYGVDALPALLDRSYDSLLWQATARRCYSCGSCNLSCPTCYCFNVFDEQDMAGGTGRRRREWDGCQLRSFASVAGGHNFREAPASRLRHRIYRKAKWVKEREGIAGCVGCARCDRACTAKISSVEIYNQLAEER